MKRRGFTFIELIVVVVILGVLANIAVPAYRDIRLRADAARVIADFTTIRLAAYDNFASNEFYPGHSGWTIVPTAFQSLLPGGFQFQYRMARYRWRRWSRRDGTPRNSNRQAQLAVQVRSSDRKFITAIRNQFKGDSYGNRGQITLIIE